MIQISLAIPRTLRLGSKPFGVCRARSKRNADVLLHLLSSNRTALPAPIFYAASQPACPQTRMEYARPALRIKIRKAMEVGASSGWRLGAFLSS